MSAPPPFLPFDFQQYRTIGTARITTARTIVIVAIVPVLMVPDVPPLPASAVSLQSCVLRGVSVVGRNFVTDSLTYISWLSVVAISVLGAIASRVGVRLAVFVAGHVGRQTVAIREPDSVCAGERVLTGHADIEGVGSHTSVLGSTGIIVCTGTSVSGGVCTGRWVCGPVGQCVPVFEGLFVTVLE
jgi:hypothetical protein